MKVLIVGLGGVTHTFRHWPERVLALALARRGHTVWAIGTHDPQRPALSARHEVIEGVSVFRVRSGYWPNSELAQALRQGPPPDIVHLMHPRNVLAAQTTAWAKKRGIPTVYTWLGPFHDHYLTADRERPFESVATYERLVFSRRALLRQLWLERRPRDVLRNYWLHWPLDAATALAPCSEFEASMMRRFGLTQPQVVVPLWIDVPFIQSIPTQPCETIADIVPSRNSGRPISRPWLLFVGQLTLRKGYDLAVQALRRVVATYPDAALLVVSGLNQQQRQHLLQLAVSAGVECNIHMLGYLSDTDLIQLYRASDMFLFPTRYEGFGLPLLEAMAAGCPIVTTDIPVVRETVQHEYNGLLVPYNDVEALAQAVLRLLGDPLLCEQLRTGGQITLREQYAESYLVGQIEELYHISRSPGLRQAASLAHIS